MKVILILAIAALCFSKPLISKEFIEEIKKNADWEVTEYEDNVFKGIDDEDFIKDCNRHSESHLRMPQQIDEPIGEDSNKKLDCSLPIRNQGECLGASFAFAVAGMVSARCCMKTGQKLGWLSTMEIMSCDEQDYGCAGGWPFYAAKYVAGGLVPEKCYPYRDIDESCPTKCTDGSDFKNAHMCGCINPTKINSLEEAKKALEHGPIVVSFDAYADLFTYKSGIYCHSAGGFKRVVSGLVISYGTTPKPHIVVMLPYGDRFGEKGYIRMCLDCCGLFTKYDKGNVAC